MAFIASAYVFAIGSILARIIRHALIDVQVAIIPVLIRIPFETRVRAITGVITVTLIVETAAFIARI